MGSREPLVPHGDLRAIYSLDDAGVDEAQSANRCKQLLGLLSRFTQHHGSALRRSAVGPLLSEAGITWHGEYGCAMMFLDSLGSCTEPRVHVYLVAIDAWRFSVHSNIKTSHEWTSSTDGSSVVLHAGSVPTRLQCQFLADFNRAFAKATAKKGDQRSAAGDAQGHQKTPSFIWAVLQDVLGKLQDGTLKVTQPPGALTDVGLHTGGKPRNTCWPLVAAAFEFLAARRSKDGGLRREFWAAFDVWVLEQVVKDFKAPLSSTGVDMGMKILQHATRKLAVMADEDRDVSQLKRRCQQMKKCIDELATATQEVSLLLTIDERRHLPPT